MHHLPSIVAAVVLLAALVAAVTDVWKFKVYNALTFPLLLAGLVYHAATGGVSGFGLALIGAVFGFVILLPFHLAGGIGAGDVKLMAGLGAWLGMALTFQVFIASAIAAGVYSVLLTVMAGGVRDAWMNLQLLGVQMVIVSRQPTLGRVETEVKRADRRRRLVPFAAMMMVGAGSLMLWPYVSAN